MNKNKLEYLSNDIFDEGFLDIYKHIHALEMLIGTCRVDARARFVTPPSKLQKLYTCILTIFIRSIVSITALVQYFQIFENYPSLYKLIVSAAILQALAILANIVHVRFVNNDENVKLYFEMQDIDTVMKITNNKTMNNIVRTVNNTTVKIILGVWLALTFLAAFGGQIRLIGCVGLVLAYGPFILEMTRIQNMVFYFFTRTSFLNAIISNAIRTSKKDVKLNYIFLPRHFMRKLAALTHEFASSETDVYLKKLIGGFATFHKLHNFQLFLFSVHNVLLVVLLSEFAIECLRYKVSITLIEYMIFGAIILMGYTQAFVMSLRCEQLYNEIKETKRLSISILSRHLEGPLRTRAKNMLKIIEETPYHFTIYDLWIVDFRLFIMAFDLITYFFITLIQFAFP